MQLPFTEPSLSSPAHIVFFKHSNRFRGIRPKSTSLFAANDFENDNPCPNYSRLSSSQVVFHNEIDFSSHSFHLRRIICQYSPSVVEFCWDTHSIPFRNRNTYEKKKVRYLNEKKKKKHSQLRTCLRSYGYHLSLTLPEIHYPRVNFQLRHYNCLFTFFFLRMYVCMCVC